MDMQLETENGVTKEVNRDMTGCRDYGPFWGVSTLNPNPQTYPSRGIEAP